MIREKLPRGPSFYERDGKVWFRYVVDDSTVCEWLASEQHRHAAPEAWAEFSKDRVIEVPPSEKRRGRPRKVA